MKNLSLLKRVQRRRNLSHRRIVRSTLCGPFRILRNLSIEVLETRTVLTAPTILELTPPDNSFNVPISSDLVMNFDEPMQKGSGTISIRNTASGATQNIPVNDSAVYVEGLRVTINPQDFAPNANYAVFIPGSAFKDLSGNNFGGINDHPVWLGEWDFTTAPLAAPTVTSINRLVPVTQHTIAQSVTFRVTFSSPVTGVTADDFTLVDVANSIEGEAITSVIGTNAHIFDVQVSTGSAGVGDLRLDVIASNATIFDLLGTALTSDFVAGQVFSIHRSGTFVVNSAEDSPDALLGDGLALDHTGHTTLRAAVMEAYAIQNEVTVLVPAGVYVLTKAGTDEETAARGDLDIAKKLTVIGASPATTIIDGDGLDRVFHVLPGADAKLSNLTIRNGNAALGGGVRNQGTLTLDNMNLTGNHATNLGGALYSQGPVSINNSSLIKNYSYIAGAISTDSSHLSALNSTIGENEATYGGGGLVTDNGGTATLTNVTVYANKASIAGGLAALNSTITLKNSIVAGNLSATNPDLHNYGSTYVSFGNNLIGRPGDVLGFIDGTNGDQVGSNANPLDPHLGPGGNYGGATIAYPLLANSTAIDRGNNTGASTTDQLGRARVTDGDDDGIDVIDMGAFEFEPLTFFVNSTEDTPDTLPGDGSALDATGRTTLRAAIMEANSSAYRVYIRIPAGIYPLGRSGQEEDGGVWGDLDVAGKVKIIGDSAGVTIIDGANLDRVFHVLPGADVKLSNMTVQNGNTAWGGGIRNQGSLALHNMHLTGNHADRGGALYSQGSVAITNSSLIKNYANVAGAIYTISSNLSALSSTIGENEATNGGGGLVTESVGTATLTNVTVYANKAPVAGGLAALNSTIRLKNTIVAGNLSPTNPDLYGSTYVSLGNNLIGRPSDVSGFIDGTNGDQVGSASPLDPHFGPAGTHGGSTVVYPLLINSTAIDHGNNIGANTTDQLGRARVIDGDDDGVDVIDMGAFEFEPLTFYVNSSEDNPDALPGDGNALDATGHTTLRAAIMEANTIPYRVHIRIPAGIYSLGRAGQDEDSGVWGDLDIVGKVKVIGDGARVTIIDGAGLDRIFHVLPGADAKLSNLTIRNGKAALGGGIRNQGILMVDKMNLTGNHASNLGGALYSQGALSITNSSLIKNYAEIAGAVYALSSNFVALNSTIGENEVTIGGGGLVTENSGSVTLTNVTVYANKAPVAGGLAALNSTIRLKNSIVAGNLSPTNPDLYGSTYVSFGNNLIGRPSDVLGFIDGTNGDQLGSNAGPLDPHLGPGGNYGGGTIVYPLLANSTAIDRGNNIGASTTDQLGRARITDGDDDGIDVIDIGANEFQLPNHRPRITSSSRPSLPENSAEVLAISVIDTDLPAQAITISLTGGVDQSKFWISPDGVLKLVTPPDFESPTDANLDNVYLLQVTASDGYGGIVTQDLSVTVTPVNDNNPVFTSTASPQVQENTTTVLSVTATDADLPAQVITYSITGGADQSKFSITAGGLLKFNTAPIYSAPTDSNADNVYLVQVTAQDGQGGLAIQDLAVRVMDVTAPTVSSLSPLDNAIGVPRTANLLLNFSEPIQKGTGSIAIRRSSDNSVFLSVPVSHSSIGVTGSTVTIDPPDFAPGTSYYVEVPAGAFKDLAGNNFAGISGPTTWNFSTVGTATFTVTGTTLLLDLNSPNTSLSIHSVGTSYTFALTGNIWIGTDSSNLVGANATTLTLTSAGLLAVDTVRVTDSSTGNSVTFTDSGTNTFTDNFSIILDNTGAGDIQFVGATTFGGGSSLNAKTVGGVKLFSGSTVRMTNGDLTLRGNSLEGNSTTVSSVSGHIISYVDSIALSGTTEFQTPGVVDIEPNSSGLSIDLGGTDRPGVLGLTDEELDRIHAGNVMIGSLLSGPLTVSAAITVNTKLALLAGNSGILSSGGSLGTTGDSIWLDTTGPIGTSTSRLLLADQPNIAKQKILIGSNAVPSSVYLGGLGSLTLGSISSESANAIIDVTAMTHLVVADSATINSGLGNVKLGSDLTKTGNGDDGIGTLTIGANANVLGGTITLTGADEEISSTATIGTNPLIATLTGTNRPRALAVDGSGNLFVANELNGTVSKFAPGATIPTSTLTQLNTPLAMAFDAGGNLFVANYGNNTVSKFGPGATTPSLVLTGLNGPDALAFDNSGNLFVANVDGTTVSKFAPGATTPTATLTGLSAPTDLLFDQAGNLFVANFNGGTVSKFAPGATTASIVLTGLVRPRSLAFDSAGNLFVTDDTLGTVKKYASGSVLPSSELTGLSYPYDLVFDSNGNLYVANFNGGTLSKFLPGSTTPNATINGLNAPTALAIDSSGNIFAANRHISTISKFAPSAASTVSIRASLNTQTITLGNTTVNTLSLTDPELDRINAGTLIVGDANSGKISFSGALTPAGINTLVVSSASDITQSFVGSALSGGAALVLRGNLTPALAAVGNFQADANTSFDTSSTFKVNLNGTNSYDQLIVSGNTHSINLGGAALSVTLDTIPSIGNVFRIIDSTGAGSSVNGTFKFNGLTLNDGDTFTIGGTHLRINYNPAGGSGDVVLTVISLIAVLGDRIWLDSNGDGIQNSGESGLPDVGVDLFSSADATIGNADDVFLGQTVTDTQGQFRFTSNSSGLHYLKIRAPVGYAFSQADRGTDDSVDSDANSSGLTGLFSVGLGQVRSDIDIGLTGAAPTFGFALAAGSTGSDMGRSVATDAVGNIYVTGGFGGTVDFDYGPGSNILTSGGSYDSVVAKYSPSGALLWARSFAGAGWNDGLSIAVAPNGYVYTTGRFAGAVDFDPGETTAVLTGSTQFSTYVSILDSAGNYIWAGQFGGQSNSGLGSSAQGHGIAIGTDGSVYIAGEFAGTMDFDPGVAEFKMTSRPSAYSDGYLVKLNSIGGFQWAIQIGGVGLLDKATSVATSGGNVVITGDFQDTVDFDPSAAAFNLTSVGGSDAFIASYSSSGSFQWADRIGGIGEDHGTGIAFTGDGGVLATGYFSDRADFDPSSGTFEIVSHGGTDAYIVSLDSHGIFKWAGGMGGVNDDWGWGIVGGANGAVYITGLFEGIADLDPGTGVFNLTSAGANDAFIAKLNGQGHLVLAVAQGGQWNDFALGIALDPNESVVTTGYFELLADFDPTVGTYELRDPGSQGIFVSKLRIGNHSPTDILAAQQPITENTSTTNGNLLFANLSAIDADGVDRHSFQLIGGVGDTDNSRFVIAGNQLLIKQGQVLDFETNATYSVRVVVTDSTGNRYERPLLLTVVNLPELIGNVVIGDGSAQRSLVKQVVLTFDGPVTLDSGAFALTKRGTPGFVPTTAVQSINGAGQVVVTLTFSGALTRGAGALTDGYYQLTIDGTKIRRGNVSADFNGDGTGGDSLVIGATEADNFFALFGDTNGDGLVSVTEYGEFRAAFGKSSQDAGYNALFDYELDQSIGVSDFGQFRSRFGKPKLRF